MLFDYYAHLAGSQDSPAPAKTATQLVSGFVDECTVRFFQQEIGATGKSGKDRGLPSKKNSKEKSDKNTIREAYMDYVQGLLVTGSALLSTLLSSFEPDFHYIVHPSWIGLRVDFTLVRPLYSKDDRVFHLLENPLRKDRVFGLPYMSAASWKGLLRWACWMRAGLQQRFEETERKLRELRDPPWIIKLFGNEKDERKEFRQGSLVFYPTWFTQLGSHVINPHRRATRAGRRPVYYEVVPEGTCGALHLLYAPLPGTSKHDDVAETEMFENLLRAVEELLTYYGISAKRTGGWGTAEVKRWTAYKNGTAVEKAKLDEFWLDLRRWLDGGERS